MHFPLFNTLRHTRLCFAALTLGLGIHLPSQAQNGTLVPPGQINTQTCSIFMSDIGGGNVTTTGGYTLRLGNVTNQQNISTAGQIFGVAQGVGLWVGGSNCLNTSSKNWDVALMLTDSQISIINNKGYLKNAIPLANGGTNAVVELKGGFSAATLTPTLNVASKRLALESNKGGAASVFMSGEGSVSPVTGPASLVMSTQFASATAANPTAGPFSQSIQLMVIYR
jgi:hypothetical protein